MSNNLDKILAEISAGELIDKITILEIKKDKIPNKDKLENIKKELLSLNDTMNKFIPKKSEIINLTNELKLINLQLWDIEDGKRECEREKNFNEKFIKLARNVYKLNDERARVKLAINNILGSNIKEVKSYE